MPARWAAPRLAQVIALAAVCLAAFAAAAQETPEAPAPSRELVAIMQAEVAELEAKRERLEADAKAVEAGSPRRGPSSTGCRRRPRRCARRRMRCGRRRTRRRSAGAKAKPRSGRPRRG